MKKKYILILTFLILLLFIVNYKFLDNHITNFLMTRDSVIVDRIIDGDTIEAHGESIRLLGINSPEKGEKGYDEAKEFLEEMILEEKVYLEYGKERKDKYDRTLAYVFLGDLNINIQSVLKGYSNYYFPSGKDKYYFAFKSAWEECIKNNKNRCEKSENVCIDCVDINYNQEKVTLINYCSFSCDFNEWTISGEGRKIFNIKENIKVDVGEQDTLFLRDKEDKLILWRSY